MTSDQSTRASGSLEGVVKSRSAVALNRAEHRRRPRHSTASRAIARESQRRDVGWRKRDDGIHPQKGTILRELRPKELRQADMLQEFVGVGTDAG